MYDKSACVLPLEYGNENANGAFGRSDVWPGERHQQKRYKSGARDEDDGWVRNKVLFDPCSSKPFLHDSLLSIAAALNDATHLLERSVASSPSASSSSSTSSSSVSSTSSFFLSSSLGAMVARDVVQF